MNLKEIDFDVQVDNENVLISINGDYELRTKMAINKQIGKELTLNIKSQKLKL